MKTAFSVGVLLAASAGAVLGNGGAYHYGVKATGSLNPFRAEGVEQVAILDEQLAIRLGPGEADVKVRYLMKNNGAGDVKVRFGFPVEVVEEAYLPWMERESRPTTAERLATNLGGYAVRADGEAVGATFREEKGTPKERARYDRRLAGIMGWMVSEVAFRKGQERIIEISYRSHYDEAGSFVSDDAHHGPKQFRYRLSTGAVWEGPIRKLRVTVTAEGVPADEVEIFKPVGRFQRDGASWTWECRDLEPTLADDLVIRAVPESRFYGDYRGGEDYIDGYFGQAGIWSMMHRLYEAEASSVLAPHGDLSYGPDHVRVRWGKAEALAWAEGAKGSGVGEWLELTPHEAKPLYAISIIPGYSKSRDLFLANNRPSQVEISLNGEHTFEAALIDRNRIQMVRVLDYAKPVRKVRVTIKDVYPGSRHDDTCISFVALHSLLAKKPEVRGAR